MRKILFRGKQTDKDKWIYGVPIKGTSADESEILIIESVFKCDEYACIGCEFTPIIPSTVGQYTGLTDKNGKKIFEGDIVKITDRNVCFETMAVIEFGNPNGLYNWGWQLKPLENKPFAIEILHWVDMEDSGAFIEVIGNIHDNPELLKGGEEE